MDNRQTRTVQMFRRAQVYLDHHSWSPEPPLYKRMREQLATASARIAALSVDQGDRMQRAETKRLAVLRQRLRRERLMPLAKIAKPLLKFAPGTQMIIRVPHARVDTLTLARHGEKVAKALVPHTRLLVSAGYAKDFLAQLRTESRELAALADGYEKQRRRRSIATAAIKREMKRGMDALGVIEGILTAHPSQSEERSAWKWARRVTAKVGRPTDRVLENRSKRNASGSRNVSGSMEEAAGAVIP